MRTEHLILAAAVAGGLALNAVFGALVLRLMCGVMQEHAPKFFRAFWIALVAFVVCVAAIYALDLAAMYSDNQAAHKPGMQLRQFVPLIAFPLTGFTTGLIYAIMIPTTMRRGLIIWFVQMVIAAVLALLVYGGALAILKSLQ